MDGNKFTFGAALIAAGASVYSAFQSSDAARDASKAAANSSIQVAYIKKTTEDRQSDIEMVKLALNILGGQISDETKESRRFAVSLLNKYSGVNIDGATGSKWAEAGTVSFAQQNLGLSSDASAFQRAIIETQILNSLQRPNRRNDAEPQMRQNVYPKPNQLPD